MSETTRPSWLPSVGDILFLLLLQLMFGLLPYFLLNDGSTGWHLVTGHYIIDHMRVPTTDLISYTFPDKPWVAYEWLFDAAIGWLDKVAGLKLVAVACGTAIATLFLLIYDDCRRSGCHFMTTLVLCITGSLVSAVHWLVRPHLVTFFGVYLFIRTLDRFCYGQSAVAQLDPVNLDQNKSTNANESADSSGSAVTDDSVSDSGSESEPTVTDSNKSLGLKKASPLELYLTLVLTMLVWVNSHPAFLMGLAILFIYLACDIFSAVISSGATRTRSIARVKVLSIAFLLTGLATLANPYGTNLYHYIHEYLQQTAVIAQTDEYRSPVFHGALQPICLELLYFALAVGLAATSRKPKLARLMVVLAFGHLSLSSVRNMPLFVIVSLPFIADLLATSRLTSLIKQSDKPDPEPGKCKSLLEPILRIWRSAGATFDAQERLCTRHVLPIITVVLLVVSCFSSGKLLGVTFVESDFDPKRVPTDNLAKLKDLDEKRGFNHDNWGGYLCYKTGKRMFIDDRVDFYGQKFYLDYGDIATVKSNWKELLDKYKIQWIIFPNNGYLTEHLKKDPNWQLMSKDQASSLFIRKP